MRAVVPGRRRPSTLFPTQRLWSPALGRPDRITYLDYEKWRTALSSFEDLGAFRETSYNVDPGDRAESAVRAAEMTASAFELTRVQPMLGRTIQPADEQPGAEAVVVLGYDLCWRASRAILPSSAARCAWGARHTPSLG